MRASGSSRSSANKFVNLCSEVHELPSNFSCVLFRGYVCRTKPGAFFFRLDLYERLQYLAVCSVYCHGVQRCEIDARGAFGVVPHAFTYDGEWDVLAPGDACPCVSAHIHGKRNGQPHYIAERLQVVIDAVRCVDVLFALG